ncbi:MAG TPA: amidase [Ktedonobacteraceae bacterium]|nr:amidase [Ktedonobacteraceae bacterium]
MGNVIVGATMSLDWFMNDPFASASTMLAALQTGQVSATELLEQHLQRIERYNPRINAIVIPNYEQARQRAAEADAARARGELLGPLHGLPLTIKDCIEVAGLRTTAGVTHRANAISTQNAPVAQRVLDAGAVLIGKTNVPPYAGDWQANNEVFGRTNNPWDLERSPGGSTGGGAAALAAGLTPLEFGSDIGGSIRIPAAFCGVYGHRPSDSAVPRYGHVPGSPLPNPAFVMGVQGPLARSAADLALALNVIAGPVVGEEVAWHLTLPAARHSALSNFRVAIMPQIPSLPVDAEITAALENLATRLGALGAKVAEAQPESFDWHKYQQTYTSLLDVFMFAELKDEDRAGIVEGLRHSSDPYVQAQLFGLTATASQFLGLLARREHYRAAFRDFFRDWDVLLTPVTITPAFPHISSDLSFPRRTLQINGEVVSYGRIQDYPGLATLSGQPATAFPWGRTRQGLPIGLQAIGPYLEDFTPIAFASLLEREFGGFVAPPGYA